MNKKYANLLKKEQQSPFVESIRNKCNKLVRMSSSVMSTYYSTWDEQHRVWKSERYADEEDKKSKEKGEPVKMVAPLSFAQVMTFVSVSMMLLKQREKFYELSPVEENDVGYQRTAETLLEQDLQYNKFDVTLFQFLLYLCKCDLAVVESSYVEHKQVLPVNVEEEVDGLVVDTSIERRQVTKFSGNEIRVVSPYSFFPDVRVPLERLHDGEFCASEEEMSKARLEELEAEGIVAGIEYITPFSAEGAEVRSQRKTRFSNLMANKLTEECEMVMVTKVQIKVIPSKHEVEPGKKLGSETYPIKYLVWIANDSRVIRLEPMDYVHDQFTYEVARFTPDDMELLSKSLTEMVGKLQESFDWFINARIVSVKKTLDPQLIVDPSGVEMSSVTSRQRIIMMKRGVSRNGIDQYIKQLNVQDVTQGHLQDANHLQGLAQMASGVNDNAMGQYHGGRRSAREAAVVSQSAGARIRMTVGLIWSMALGPLGQKMLINLRSVMPRERFDKVVPAQIGQVPVDAEQQWALFHPSNLEDLVNSSDFFLFDGTLPSEKGFMAQALQELLGVVMSNPQAAQQFDISPNMILQEIMRLNGTMGSKRFSFFNDPQALQQMLQQVFMAGQQSVMPQGTQPQEGSPV
jgi:hypothetical protein